MTALMTEPQVLDDDLPVTFSDVAGQRVVTARLRRDMTVGEAMRHARARMSLPETSLDGNPVSYRGHLEESAGVGRPLASTERVGDALSTGARVVVQEEIQAG